MRDEVVRECEEEPARKKMPATMQKTYIRRAEKEIASRAAIPGSQTYATA